MRLSASEAKTVEAELLKKYRPVRISRNRAKNERNNIIYNNPTEIVLIIVIIKAINKVLKLIMLTS
jgi:hypothetical protein